MPTIVNRTASLLAAAAFAAAGVPAAMAQAPQWAVDQEASRIAVVGTQTGEPFEAVFEDFQADIAFDPNDLAASEVSVTIDVSSFESGSDDRDELATDDQWFDVDSWPEAEFHASSFRHLEGNRYEADGTLRIRDASRDLTLPFTLDIENGRADMHGEVQVDRTNYNLGQGDFATGELVGHDVTIIIDLTAERVE